MAFRITTDDDDKIRELCEHFKAAIAVKEISKNEVVHYHGLIKDDVTRQTIRNNIERIFKDEFYKETGPNHPKKGMIPKGNAFFSQKNPYKHDPNSDTDPIEGYIKYISKGNEKGDYPDVVFNSTKYNTDKLHDQFWESRDAWLKERQEARKAGVKIKRSNKDKFKHYYVALFSDGTIDPRECSIEHVIKEYCLWCQANDVEPTPKTSGQTMILYLVNKVAGMSDDDNPWEHNQALFGNYYDIGNIIRDKDRPWIPFNS